MTHAPFPGDGCCKQILFGQKIKWCQNGAISGLMAPDMALSWRGEDTRQKKRRQGGSRESPLP
jgi:hypothetical protein